MNVALSGLEEAIQAATKREDKVNVIVYADDFIITGATREVLDYKVKPIIEDFLSERGLKLSKDKTKITRIEEGFDFLGVNVRKYNNGKLIQKPAKNSVKHFLRSIRETVKHNKAVTTEILIRLLNPKIMGWANYHCHYCSKKTFGYVSSQLFKVLWRWAKRRHPNKGSLWVSQKYYRTRNNRRWVFSTKIKNNSGKSPYLDLVEIAHTHIKRHVKIKSDATPFDPAYREYFRIRQTRRREKRLFFPCKSQWSAWWEM